MAAAYLCFFMANYYEKCWQTYPAARIQTYYHILTLFVMGFKENCFLTDSSFCHFPSDKQLTKGLSWSKIGKGFIASLDIWEGW